MCSLGLPQSRSLERAEQADAYIFACQSHYGAINGRLAMLVHRFVTADKPVLESPWPAWSPCRRSGATRPRAAKLLLFHEFHAHRLLHLLGIVLVGSTRAARQDQEGLRTMRNLARSMAWLLKSIESGRQSGLAPLQPE